MKNRKLLSDVVARPVKRMSIIIVLSLGWFFAWSQWSLAYGPQFGFWEQWIHNYGTTDNDVFLFWTWVPILLMYFAGMLWASGIFGDIQRWLE